MIDDRDVWAAARDKLLAALNWFYGKLKRNEPYDRAPMYFDACLEWHERLSADDQETCRTAPRCPL